MKVLYDHQIFSTQIIGGISRYIYELAIRNKEAKIGVIYSENLYLKKNKQIFSFKGKMRIIYFLNKIFSNYLINFKKFDLLHITYYDNYFLKNNNKKFVVTVHDMIHEIYKDIYFSKNDPTLKLKKEICEKATGIIAISEQTKNDLIRILNINPDKIEVIYHGSNLKKIESSVKLPSRYILFVGSRGDYKNFNKFLDAASNIVKQDSSLYLLCVGKKFNLEEQKYIKQLGIDNKVKQLLAVDEDMYSIYKKAQCFVFPSLYEGFGIPILEAFESECPLVLSNTSCFPEIAEDAAEYFNPKSQIEIEQAIKNVIYNERKKEDLRKKGKERLRNFSWDKTYEQTIKFYRKILDR